MSERYDIAVIGGGPAGAATALQAARQGARVVVFDKAAAGRDKVCGDGLTPRAVGALERLGIRLDGVHRTVGLRMLAGKQRRELAWPSGERFPPYGAVWPRASLDAALINAAAAAGADVRFGNVAEPTLGVGTRVAGVTARTAGTTATTTDARVEADLVVVATGAPGKVAKLLGTERVADEPYGLAIRTYIESPRHADQHLEANLMIADHDGTTLPGYGWMFPCGDGTVNLGVGALSTTKRFGDLNLNRLIESYRQSVADEWSVGEFTERPRAWRLPMSAQRRHGPGWLAVGDAAGLINPMNGEGIDYALESGIIAADCYLTAPSTAPVDYDRVIAAQFDEFLATGRRFAFVIGHPWMLRTGLRFAIGTDALAALTVQIMGNLVDGTTEGLPGHAFRAASRTLRLADPALRRWRAA